MAEGADIRNLALSLTMGFAACGSPTVTSTQPMSLPMSVVPVLSPLPDGGTTQIGLRLVTSLSVFQDGSPIEASIDTGSSGIQLVANLLPSSAIASLGQTQTLIDEIFPESGIEATGYLATATPVFGTAATSSPIPVAVLVELSCVPGSICPVDAGSLEPYLFNGSPCLLGVGMRASGGVGNPIVQLPGQPSFIIEAPSFGADGGTLRIAPTDEELANYQIFQLPDGGAQALQNGVSGWNDLTVPACVDDLTTKTDYCADALLDTGTPLIEIDWKGNNGYLEVAPGMSLSVSIGPTASPLGAFNVTIGSPPQFGLDLFVLAPPVQNLGQLVILGLPVFSRYNVLFDQAKGQIGLLAH